MELGLPKTALQKTARPELLSYAQHDLSLGMAALAEFLGPARFIKRQDNINVHLNLTPHYQVGNLPKFISPAMVASDEQTLGTMCARNGFRRRLND